MKTVMLILVISISLISYLIYNKYTKDKEYAQYIGASEARLFDYWVIKHREKNISDSILKSQIFFDLNIIKIEKIKDKLDKKQYCMLLKDIKYELIEYNKTSAELIEDICY